MPVERTAALVIGGFPLGESDRVVAFFTRRFGKVRGVARAARRVRSRFAGALELFTLGELVFFDAGRSDLVQVDHFDIVRPFDGVRSTLDRLGHAAWMVECVGRLTAERDASPPLFTLLARALTSVEGGAEPGRVAVAFGVRALDLLGHRLRTDACVACARTAVVVAGRAAIDVEAGGTVCPPCARALGGTISVGVPTLGAFRRLRIGQWDDSHMTAPVTSPAVRAGAVAGAAAPAGGVAGRAAASGPPAAVTVERELRTVLDAQVARLAGQTSRASRFLREVGRAFPALPSRPLPPGAP